MKSTILRGRFTTPVVAVTLCTALGAAWGAEPLDAPAFRLNPIVSAGLTFGGDTIATYRTRSFGVETELDVEAGGTLLTFGGVAMQWPRQHVGLLLQGGRFISSVSSVSNDNFETLGQLTRWPVELIGFFDWKRFRTGIGVTRHLSPKFDDETATDVRFNFGDATGAVLQVDYLFERWSVGLRHVAIDYTLETSNYETGTRERNADHWGVVAAYRFGKMR